MRVSKENVCFSSSFCSRHVGIRLPGMLAQGRPISPQQRDQLPFHRVRRIQARVSAMPDLGQRAVSSKGASDNCFNLHMGQTPHIQSWG
jgi:hypothetical protein